MCPCEKSIKNQSKMKLTTIKSAKFTLMALVLLNVMSCNTNDDEPLQENKTPITRYHNTEELLKLHNGSEKSWRFTQVIMPEQFYDYNSVIKSACVSDDIYTFKPFTADEKTPDVDITLGENLCFDEISDSESYESQLYYTPVLLDDEYTYEVRLQIGHSRHDEAENFTRTSVTSFILTELTEDRAVFALGDYIEDYSYAWIFEKVE